MAPLELSLNLSRGAYRPGDTITATLEARGRILSTSRGALGLESKTVGGFQQGAASSLGRVDA